MTAIAPAPTDLPALGAVPLTGRVMSQLCAAEQLVIWYVRSACAEEPKQFARLSQGFAMAFGAALAGAALCAFDGWRRCLDQPKGRQPSICPLTCACLAADEQTLLSSLAAAQLGDRITHDTEVARFVLASELLQLWRYSRLVGEAMLGAELVLPESRVSAAEANRRPH